jgi:cell division protein FtsB
MANNITFSDLIKLLNQLDEQTALKIGELEEEIESLHETIYKLENSNANLQGQINDLEDK